MKIVFRKPVDIFIALIWTVISCTLAIIDVKGAIRVIFGLPFVIFIPGYVLTFALFPGKKDIDTIERIALSFGLSIAVVPLVGLILNYTPFGIRLEPIVISLSSFVFILSGIGLYRWYSLHEKRRFTISFEFSLPENRVERILTIALIFAIVASICLLIYIIATPRQGERFTEFYILGPEGKAEGYPTNLSINEPGKVIIGIVNHEGKPVNYTVETWLLQKPFALSFDGKDDYVKVSDNESLHMQDEITVEAWVWYEGGKSQTILAKDTSYEIGKNVYDDEINEEVRNADVSDGTGNVLTYDFVGDSVIHYGMTGIYLRLKIDEKPKENVDVVRLEVWDVNTGTKIVEDVYKSDEFLGARKYYYGWEIKHHPRFFVETTHSYRVRVYYYAKVSVHIEKLIFNRYHRAPVQKPSSWRLYTSEVAQFLVFHPDKTYTYANFGLSQDYYKKWIYVAGTYSKKDGLKLYFNGKMVANVPPNNKSIRITENPIIIGSGTHKFIGKIDDIRIYNRALTAEEIYQNYLENVTTVGLVSWWKFDEGVGKIVHDCIDGNDGMIHGATWTEPKSIIPEDAWFMGKIEIRLNSTTINIEEERQPQWEYDYIFSINKEGVFKLAFLLFKGRTEDFVVGRDYPEEIDRVDKAYRECHLWITIK